MNRLEGRIREPFAPRMQFVPESEWSIAEWGGEGTIVGVVRVRSTMRDCPGDLGRVARVRYGGSSMPPEWDWYEYQAPRDVHAVRDADSGEYKHPREYKLGERGRRFRARGEALRGRAPSPPGEDWSSVKPLGAYDKRGETWGLGDGTGVDSEVLVHCPHCPRKMQVTRAGAAARLDEA